MNVRMKDDERERIAIIGGTGFHLRHGEGVLVDPRDEVVATRWGSARVTLATLDGRQIVFLDRHRASAPEAPRLPPHRIDYRANIAALKKLGVKGILASNAVGSLDPTRTPGTLVLPDQLLDLTSGRPKTFFDDAPVHVDFTQPYCGHLRGLVRSVARSEEVDLDDGGTYVCTDGPRFETAAEIRAYRGWGGDVVGMTAAPEGVLAREAQISYAGVSVVTNLAAGVGDSTLTEAEVLETMSRTMPDVARLFLATASRYRDDPRAPARRATLEFGSPDIV